MVNYLYDPRFIETNHEAFANHGTIVASNAVEVYIHRLRKQLSERGAKVQIHTIRGVGYLISEEKAA